MAEDIPPTDDREALLHEIDFLQGRVKNLNVFKKMFFTLQEDLVEERKTSAELESRLKELPQAELQVSSIDSDATQNDISDLQNESLDGPVIVSEDLTELSEIDKLKQDHENLEQLNQLLISVADEYLSVIDFYSKGSTLSSYKDLIELLFESVINFNCEASVEIHCDNSELYFFFNEKLQDEHTSLLRRLKIRGRLVEENNAICINFSRISLLVDGLSKYDERAYSRVKEILLLLVSSADNIIKALDLDKKLQDERNNLYKIVCSTKKNIKKIEQDIALRIKGIGDVQIDFIAQIASAIAGMNVSNEDKKTLYTLLNTNKMSISSHLKNTYVLDANFLDVISRLEKAYCFIDKANNESFE